MLHDLLTAIQPGEIVTYTLPKTSKSILKFITEPLKDIPLLLGLCYQNELSNNCIDLYANITQFLGYLLLRESKTAVSDARKALQIVNAINTSFPIPSTMLVFRA